MAFKNREEAAEKLVDMIRTSNIAFDIVLALPRGGVPIGVKIAEAFDKPIDLVIPRKIGMPGNEEYAIGAVTEEGDAIWNEDEAQNIEDETRNELVAKQRKEAARRRNTYLKERPRANIADKTVLLVDDGIATGMTMRAAIKEVRQQAPKKIIVAVPVAPPDTVNTLKKEVDDLIVLKKPMLFMAIGQFYETFDQVTDKEVVEQLK